MTERPVSTMSPPRNSDTSDAAERRAANEVTVEAELLRLALEAGNAVGWDWDIGSGRLLWFGNLQTMFGMASTTFVGRVEDFRASVHPEDRDFVSAAVSDAMKRRAAHRTLASFA